ncbi:MAG: hypothetical protein Q9182_000186 [Xanthomendoza sp. 2 TL-2023]
MASFAEATAVQSLDSHTYQAQFPDEYCIGNVPHGGFVTSCFLSATALHFSTTLAALHQPHTITLHLTFLRRTIVGPARLTIRDVKLGRRTSTIHLSLTQPDNAEPSVVGYFTQSNLHTEQGISLPTKWALYPPPLPLSSSTRALKNDTDPNWTHHPVSTHLSDFRKAARKTDFYLPRQGQLEPAMADEWICLADGGKFTQTSLGFVADQFPQIVEIYPGTAPAGAQLEGQGSTSRREAGRTMWYPTVLLNSEVKKALPEEGVEWLFVRVRAKKIEKGRMDLEVVVLDEEGELVAVSQHVCLIMGAERNLRRGRGSRM